MRARQMDGPASAMMAEASLASLERATAGVSIERRPDELGEVEVRPRHQSVCVAEDPDEPDRILAEHIGLFGGQL